MSGMLRTLSVVLGLSAAALAAGDEWAKGVPVLTDWDKAIKQARTTGRILFIYNGWKGRNI